MKRFLTMMLVLGLLLSCCAQAASYTTRLTADTEIYRGPGYAYGYARDVGKDGVYTIVQEALDYEGNTWGRLKSGIGWVNFTDVRTTGRPVISVDFANRELLNNGGYLLYESDDPNYATTIVFYAHEMLRDVSLYGLLFDGEEYLTDPLYHFELFYEDIPLVAELPFYGDMTTYGISFTDAAGNERCFEVYISGRDGTPVIQEYVP